MVGAGPGGCAAALYAKQAGHEVTVIEMAKKMLPQPMFKMNESLLRKLMAESGVTFRAGTKLLGVESSRESSVVTVEKAKKQETIECDTILMALGFAPTSAAAEAFNEICPVTVVGDAKEARKILYAVGEAYEAVKKISQ